MRRFRLDQRGVSAVEFALLAPVMIAFYFGVAEFCQVYIAQKRIAHTASIVADMIAQTDRMSTGEIDDIFGVGQIVIKPYSGTTLKMRVSSVTRDPNGVAKVDWSRGDNMAARNAGDTITIPAGLIENGESVIVSESNYGYSSPVGFIIKSTLPLRSTFYLRPRRVDKVICTDC